VKAVSGKDFCKALEQNGWTLLRIKGSHHHYAKEGVAHIVSVPVHGSKDLATGLQSTLMKSAKLTTVDL